MKASQQICIASVLTLTLAFSAFAGDMSTTFAGQIQTSVTTMDAATEIVLNLAQSVLALF